MNYHYYNRYIKFIEHCKSNPVSEGEVHHIIPKCMGGDDNETNLIMMGYRHHYIAHYLLAKSYNTDKLWFAFNMMKRVCEGKSVLYEAARKFIRLAVSKNNSGRSHSIQSKTLMSRQRTGMVVVKNKDGAMFRTSVDNPDYISGELVFYRKGTKHKDHTIKKMKENSIRGKIICHDPLTGKWKYVMEENNIPVGYIVGSGPLFKKNAVQRKRVSLWYTHLETLTYKRFGVDDIIPEGYVKGRKNMKKDKDGRFIKTK